jgi:hypothetical protein
VIYTDSSIALPLLTAYARERRAARPLRRLYARRAAMMDRLVKAYRAALEFRDQRAEEARSQRTERSEKSEKSAKKRAKTTR